MTIIIGEALLRTNCIKCDSRMVKCRITYNSELSTKHILLLNGFSRILFIFMQRFATCVVSYVTYVCFVGRSSAMERDSRCSLAQLGNPRVLFGGCEHHASSPYAGKGHLQHGQGSFPRQDAALHGRHSLGAPRNPSER